METHEVGFFNHAFDVILLTFKFFFFRHAAMHSAMWSANRPNPYGCAMEFPKRLQRSKEGEKMINMPFVKRSKPRNGIPSLVKKTILQKVYNRRLWLMFWEEEWTWLFDCNILYPALHSLLRGLCHIWHWGIKNENLTLSKAVDLGGFVRDSEYVRFQPFVNKFNPLQLSNEFQFPVASFHHGIIAEETYLVPDLLKKAWVRLSSPFFTYSTDARVSTRVVSHSSRLNGTYNCK